MRIVAGETYDALAAADAAIVKCGTATLETGVLGTPMVNVYRAGWFNYAIMRPLISSEYFSLVNLVAKEHLAVELIQTQFTAKRAADELAKLLDPAVNKKKREELRRAMARLGSMDSSRLAAEAVLRVADPAANGAS
ncbi:MAG: hypothetical protein JO053_02225 [Acidobacteria bacterium]|nr:hypothetical protein [Acidobacteriota bacterium]